MASALLQVPAGWLSDSFGARWTLTPYIVGWSLATVGLGLAGGLVAISAMRILLGIMQAGAYPAADLGSALLLHGLRFSAAMDFPDLSVRYRRSKRDHWAGLLVLVDLGDWRDGRTRLGNPEICHRLVHF